jgi:hypothetical protein
MNDDNHLPTPAFHRMREYGLPFAEISDTELPVEQLGQAIVANYEAGRAAGNEASNRLVTAGLLLIEAQSRGLVFEEFLRDYCNGLSRSWAYDLIAIARGKIDELRAKAKARKRRYREQAANARVRPGTDSKSDEVLLAEFVQDTDARFRRMSDETLKRAKSFVAGWGGGDSPILDLPACAKERLFVIHRVGPLYRGRSV